jgi:hypothetical protein
MSNEMHQGWPGPNGTESIDTSLPGSEMIIDQDNFALMVSDH